MSQPATPRSRPDLPWRQLVGTIPTAKGPFHFDYRAWWCAIVTGPSGVRIYLWNQRTGASFERPCSHESMAILRAIDFARQAGG